MLFLAAVVDARPSRPFWGRTWVEHVLSQYLRQTTHDSALQSGVDQLRGWSVGSVFGSETLVQSRPILRKSDADPVEDLLRTPAACTLASFVSAPPQDRKVRSTRIARFRRWIGIRAGEEIPRQERERIFAALPAFLSPAPEVRNDDQLVFMWYCSLLHELGGLGAAYAEQEQIRHALHKLGQQLKTPTTLLVTDGRTLGILHQHGTLLYFEPPPDCKPPRSWRWDEKRGPTASLLFWHPHLPARSPEAGAERVAEGVLSIMAANPSHLIRDPA